MVAPLKEDSPVIKAIIISLGIVTYPFPFIALIVTYLLDFVKRKCYNIVRKERTFMAEFYDGTKLLSMSDLNGRQPEIYLTTGNRSIGKTTWFNRYCVKDFIKKHKKFCLVYRWNYELSDCADKFFKDIQRLFFPDYEMTEKRRANNIFVELFLNEESCGYCVTLNNADALKKFSHLLSDVDKMIFDEFQSENAHYCPNELNKLLSIHTSIARGNGEQVRRVPIYMLSNKVSLINPYFLSLGISDRLRDDTKFLKGDGFVLEQTYMEEVANAQLDSAFNRAFKNESYVAYAAQNVYLNDSTTFIEKPEGSSTYVATFRNESTDYSVRYYPKAGLYYVDKSVDNDYKVKLSFDANSHDVDYIMANNQSPYVLTLRVAFERGMVRFRNQECKHAFFECLRYSIV